MYRKHGKLMMGNAIGRLTNSFYVTSVNNAKCNIYLYTNGAATNIDRQASIFEQIFIFIRFPKGHTFSSVLIWILMGTVLNTCMEIKATLNSSWSPT